MSRNAHRFDAIVTGWIALDSMSGRPFVAAEHRDAQRLARGTRRLALVTSWHGDRFHPASIRALAARPAALGAAAKWIAARAARDGYEGLVFDFEELEPRDLQSQLLVMRAVRDSARTRGVRLVATAIPASNAAYPARRLLEVADFVIVMLYDQHWLTSAPGPIADPAWAAASLAARVTEAGDPGRVVAALPLYGYRWRRGAPTEIVSFSDARRIATATRTPLTRDAATYTLRASRLPEWDMWISDASLLERLIRDAQRSGVHRIAFWRLGQEDPDLWRRLAVGARAP